MKKGDRVMILDGLFQDCSGTITEVIQEGKRTLYQVEADKNQMSPYMPFAGQILTERNLRPLEEK